MSSFDKVLCSTLIIATALVVGFAIVRPASRSESQAAPSSASPVRPSSDRLPAAPTGAPEVPSQAEGVLDSVPVVNVTVPTAHRVTGLASVQDARRYALARLGPRQYHCLDVLFIRESHWNPRLLSRSGAYGIPQALPGRKMASAGADWRVNPLTQVRWGLGYIKARYGTACSALAHSNRTGWY